MYCDIVRTAEHKKGGGLSAKETWEVTLAACTAGRAAHLLRHGDHHPRFRARLCAHGTGGEALSPLAFTKTFAMIGSTLLAVTLVPVLVLSARARAVSFGGKQHRDEVPAAPV
jgi:Cu(I)/Ag(I) efflux system membrane protein CusA/SilA